MKKFPHEKFLQDNNIDYKTLPEMLYKRIKGFEELKEDLEHTTDEDKEKLIDKLETLSHELLEDLEEHFEDQLENNDQEEDEQPVPIQEPVQEQPVVEEQTPEPEIQPQPETEPIAIEPEALREPSDEEILEELVANKKHVVLPSELQRKGFKTGLDSKRLVVGKFCLQRGKYDTCYKIIITG